MLEDSQQTPGPCRSAGLGWLGWYWVVSLTSDQSGHLSRLEQEPGWDHASHWAQAAARCGCRHQITSRASFVFVQSSFSQVLSSPGPADDVTSWPAVAAAPSCSSRDVMMRTPAGHFPVQLGDLALVTTFGHCSCRTEDWAGLGSDHTTSSL